MGFAVVVIEQDWAAPIALAKPSVRLRVVHVNSHAPRTGDEWLNMFHPNATYNCSYLEPESHHPHKWRCILGRQSCTSTQDNIRSRQLFAQHAELPSMQQTLHIILNFRPHTCLTPSFHRVEPEQAGKDLDDSHRAVAAAVALQRELSRCQALFI